MGYLIITLVFFPFLYLLFSDINILEVKLRPIMRCTAVASFEY